MTLRDRELEGARPSCTLVSLRATSWQIELLYSSYKHSTMCFMAAISSSREDLWSSWYSHMCMCST